MQPWTDPVLKRLRSRGLALSERHAFRIGVAVVAIMAPVLVLGPVRIGLGIQRDKPVGLLVALVIALAVATIAIARVNRLATGLGDEALARLHTIRARALRAPLSEELLLAFAVTGPAVLAGSAWAAYKTAFEDGSSGDGCGGCGGD